MLNVNKAPKPKALNSAQLRNLQHNVAVLVMERKQTNERLNELEYKLLELTEELIAIKKFEAEQVKLPEGGLVHEVKQLI